MAKVKKSRTKRGAFIRALFRWSEKASKKLSNSFIGRLLCGYFSLDKKVSSSAAARIVSEGGPVTSALSSLRDGVCRAFSKSVLRNKITSLLIDLLYIRTRDIGIYLFSSGMYAAIEYLIIKYAVADVELSASVLYGAIAVMAVSLFFFFGKSLADTFNKNKVLSFVVFDLIGADRNRLSGGGVRVKNASIALLLGMLTGAAAFIVPPHRVVLVIVYAVVFCTVLFTPESGVVLMLTAIPFLPLKTILLLCGVTTVSYIIKVIRKKRELRFGTLDIAVMLLSALTLFGKMISVKEDYGTDTLYLLGIAGYFICRNTLCKREWLDRALHAAALSATVVSWFGLLFYFCGTPEQMIASRSLFAGVGGEITVFFGNSLTLACYTILTAPLLLYFAFEKKRGRILYLLSFFASFAVLVLTMRAYAIIAFIAAVVLVLAVYSKKTFVFAVLSVPAAALFAVFMPSSWQHAVFEKIYTENALISNVWAGVMKMTSNSFLDGYGIGSFKAVYPGYAVQGYASQTGAKSVYLQLLAEGGVMLALVFAVCILLFFMFCFSSASKSVKRRSAKRSIYAPLTAVLAAAVFGLTENLFSAEIVTLLTFSVMGCGAAAAEISRRESEYELSVMSWQEV